MFDQPLERPLSIKSPGFFKKKIDQGELFYLTIGDAKMPLWTKATRRVFRRGGGISLDTLYHK